MRRLWKAKLCLTNSKHSVNAHLSSAKYVKLETDFLKAVQLQINMLSIVVSGLWANGWFFPFIFVWILQIPTKSVCYPYNQRQKVKKVILKVCGEKAQCPEGLNHACPMWHFHKWTTSKETKMGWLLMSCSHFPNQALIFTVEEASKCQWTFTGGIPVAMHTAFLCSWFMPYCPFSCLPPHQQFSLSEVHGPLWEHHKCYARGKCTGTVLCIQFLKVPGPR